MSIESPSQPKTSVAARSKDAIPDGPPADWRAPVRLADAAVLTAFLSLTFLLGMFPLKDTDFWWHLRTGDLIRQTGKIPSTDIFLFTREGTPWIDLHWGFQVLISLVHEWGRNSTLGGIVALNLAKCCVTTAAVCLLITAKRREWPIWAMVLAWLPALLVLNGRMYVRPETLSLLYLSIEMAILFRWHGNPRLAWLLPVVMLAWVNCHGLFILGLIILGFALIDASLRRGAFGAGRGPWWRTILAASLATGLVCLINPYGIIGAIYPLELAQTMNNPIFNDNIAELKSIPAFIASSGDVGFRNVPLILHFSAMLLGALSFAIPLGWQLSSSRRRGGGLGILGLWDDAGPGGDTRRKGTAGSKSKPGSKSGKKATTDVARIAAEAGVGWKLSPFRVLLYVAFSILSLKATRNSHQFAAVVGTVTAWNFGEWAAAVRRFGDRLDPRTASNSIGRPGTPWLAPRLSTIAVVAAVFVSVAGGWFYRLCGENRTVGLGEEPLWFPHEAAKFAGQPGMPDRFLAFHVGHVSLLEYYNGPKKKGYADARLEVVGPELFRSYLELENEIHPQTPSWERHLEALGNPSVLVEHEMHAINGATLLASPHWKCVWFDLVAAVFVHDSYAGAVQDYEVDFATRHFRKDPANEPQGILDLVALAKAARNYLNVLHAIPTARESLTYPFLWSGIDAALQVIRIAPDNPEAWKYLGQIEMARPAVSGSVSPKFSLSFDPVRDLGPLRATYALRRANELIPEDYTTLLGLSASFSERGMLGEAKAALEKVGRLRSINQTQTKFTLESRGVIEDIREKMGDAPALEWRNLSELDQIVSKLIASGRIAELADFLERAYPVDRASWEEVDKIATTRLQLGQPSRARELWSRAKPPPRPGIRQARIAVTYFAEGALDLARNAYREAIESAPELFEAHYGLAVLEQDAGNADEAHDHALIAMDLAKNDDIRFKAAQGIAGRVSRFLTRPSKVPALRIE